MYEDLEALYSHTAFVILLSALPLAPASPAAYGCQTLTMLSPKIPPWSAIAHVGGDSLQHSNLPV